MNSRGSGLVGYNVQSAVDSKHHLIIAHEVTNVGSDRSQMANVARQAKETLQAEALDVVADRGYYNGDDIRDCEQAGIDAYLPKPKTSPNKARGQFDRAAFKYVEKDDEYECPAGAARDCRASVRHHQVLDGCHALPDEDFTQSQYRDEPACTRLQHKTSHQSTRNKRHLGSDPSVSSFASIKITSNTKNICRSSTRKTKQRLNPTINGELSHSLGHKRTLSLVPNPKITMAVALSEPLEVSQRLVASLREKTVIVR